MRNIATIELKGHKVSVEFVAEFNHFSKEPYFCLLINDKIIARTGTRLSGHMSNIKLLDEHYFFTDVDCLEDISVLPQALGLTRRIIWSNNQINMRYKHNEVGEAFFEVSTKWPRKVNKTFELFLDDVVRALCTYNPFITISLDILHDWFREGKITEEEADRRIQHFYVYNYDNHFTPETVYEQDWTGKTIKEVPNKFIECKDAVSWCNTMNSRYISRNPYEVRMMILKK
jgi:hypothetical protein